MHDVASDHDKIIKNVEIGELTKYRMLQFFLIKKYKIQS